MKESFAVALAVPFKLSTLYISIAVPVAMAVMAFAHLMNTVPILILYAVCGGIFVIKPVALRLHLVDCVCLIFPIYCALSMLWSDSFYISSRGGLQFLSMAACALILARNIPLERFGAMALAGIIIVLIINVIDGSIAYDIIDGGYAFIGLLRSKNQIGLWAEIGILFLLCHFLTTRKRNIRYGVLMPIGLFMLYVLHLSDSKSSILSMIAVMGLLWLARQSRHFKRDHRPAFFWTLMLLGTAAAVAFFGLGLHLMVLELLGKDPTLTGRTELWQSGIEAGNDNPWVGSGYGAFWVQGNFHAERLWEEYFIAGRNGFHFHNLFVQTYTDLGLIGFLMMLIMLLTTCYRSTTLLLNDPTDYNAHFLFVLAYLFLIRSMVEVDTLGPFGIGALLFYVLLSNCLSLQIHSKEERKPVSETTMPAVSPHVHE
jgi:exopolysaccharide production protein ExoQ